MRQTNGEGGEGLLRGLLRRRAAVRWREDERKDAPPRLLIHGLYSMKVTCDQPRMPSVDVDRYGG